MGNVKERISEITDNKIALQVGEDVDKGMGFHEIVEKYGKTPEIIAEIKEIAAKIEASLKAGKPLKEVLDFHFDDEELKQHVHKHATRIRAERKK